METEKNHVNVKCLPASSDYSLTVRDNTELQNLLEKLAEVLPITFILDTFLQKIILKTFNEFIFTPCVSHDSSWF